MTEETEGKEIVIAQKQAMLMEISKFPMGMEKQTINETLLELSKAPFYQKMGGIPAMKAIVLTGRELGVAPMASLNGGFWDILGRISMSAEMMRAKFRTAGHSLNLIEYTDKICTLKGTRKNKGDECTMSFSINDAAKANLLNKDNWKKSPKDMLMASCTRKVVRFLAPELLAGTGIDETEFIDITPGKEAEVETSIDTETALFIDRFNLLDLECAAAKFVKSISVTLAQSLPVTITQCSRDSEKFKKNLERFIEKTQ